MEKRTMGAFMAALRKANGLTQQQVADKLNVSNKTVSKWECNEGYPEITMLPAIAELYSVSVDELLRGERIISSTAIESTPANEERVKYLITKTMTKFTNNSIISIVLGAVALVLAYTICDIVYDYNVLWIGYVIILILTGVSVAVAMVAFNNFLSGLRNEDIVEKDNIKENIKKSIKYITVISFLTLVTLLGLLCDVIMDGPSFLLVALPATAVAGGAISWFFRSFLYKKYDISDTGLSPQQKIYRKRHIKITSVILVVVLGLSLVLPFIFAWHEVSEHSIYSYPEGVGYQYDSRAEAEREYYKLKDYVTGKKTLYFINDEYYSEETDEYVLYAEPLCDTFENNGNGYNRVSTELMPEEEFRFKNHTDMEKFKSENACDDLNQHNMQQRNLIFDDKTLSVSYQAGTVSMTNSVGDIFPAFVLIGSCGFIVVFVISLAVYFKNKKKLQ